MASKKTKNSLLGNVMKRILFLSLLFIPLIASEDSSKFLRLAAECSKAANNVNILYSPNSSKLFIHENEIVTPIESHSMDTLLNVILKKDSLDHSALSKFLSSGYISAVKQSDNSYFLRSAGRLPGGGPTGATIGGYTGKFLVSFAGHMTLHLIACASGPAYIPTMAALEVTFGPTIEAASTTAAVIGCITGALVTGPV